jgi:hypothetical protein
MRLDRRLEAPVLFLHLSALVLVIGPFLFFGAAVAPSLFRVLPTRDLAARIVSPVLSAACLIAEVAFGVLFATAWYLGREGFPKLTRSLFTRLPVAGFFAALVVRELLIPPIDKIRQEAPGLIDQLPAADTSRILLERYHRLSTGFIGVLLVVGVVMLVLTVRLLAMRRDLPTPGASRPPVPKLLDLS